MKFSFFTFLFLFLFSCGTQKESKEVKIPSMRGKIYLFEESRVSADSLDSASAYLNDLLHLNNNSLLNTNDFPEVPQLTDLIFINDIDFAATFYIDYRQKYIKGTYQNKASEIILNFDSFQYDAFYPPVLAISAVDTTEYLPIVTTEKAILNKLVLTKGKNNWTLTTKINDLVPMIGVEKNNVTFEEMKIGFSTMGVGFLFDKSEKK
jgi:hypothetical protein